MKHSQGNPSQGRADPPHPHPWNPDLPGSQESSTFVCMTDPKSFPGAPCRLCLAFRLCHPFHAMNWLWAPTGNQCSWWTWFLLTWTADQKLHFYFKCLEREPLLEDGGSVYPCKCRPEEGLIHSTLKIKEESRRASESPGTLPRKGVRNYSPGLMLWRFYNIVKHWESFYLFVFDSFVFISLQSSEGKPQMQGTKGTYWQRK